MFATSGELDPGPPSGHDGFLTGKKPQAALCHATRTVERQGVGRRITFIDPSEWEERHDDVPGGAGKVRLADNLHGWRHTGPCAANILAAYRPAVRSFREPQRHLGFDTGEPA